jgi:hypothetical protein
MRILTLTLALACAGEAQHVLNVADSGARGDGAADDGPAIRAALRRAAELAPPVELRLASRVYRIGPREDRWCSFDLHGVRDLTLSGNGATLLLHPHNCGFLLDRCTGVVLRNLKIDYNPLPFTQGDVVSLDPEHGAFTVRIHEGYPLPGSLTADLRHGAFIEPDRPRYTGHWLYLGSVERLSTEGRLVRIVAKAGDEGRVAGAAVGQRFVFGVPSLTKAQQDSRFLIGQEPSNRGVYLSNPAGTIQLMLCRDCRIESIDHYASIGMTYRLTGCDNITLRKVRIIRKPGTDRLAASLSDGIHCKNSRVGPFIEDCTFEALLDDSINIPTMSDDVMERLSPTTFLTLYSDIAWYDTPIRTGDTVLVFDPVHAVYLGEAEVTAAGFISSHQRRVTLDREVPGIVDAKTTGREHATKLFVKVTRGAQVRNCAFRSQMKTAMVFRTPGLIQGNRVEDCFFGVHCHNAPDWGEGPMPGDLTIRGNTFRRVTYAAIAALRIGQTQLEPDGGPLCIEGNRFVMDNGVAIRLTNLRGITLRDNRITMAGTTPAQYRAVQIDNCADVTTEGLRVVDPRPTAP